MGMQNPFDIKLPESIDKSANNILDKPTKEIGETIGDIFYLIFGGIQHAAAKKRLNYSIKLEQFEHELRDAALRIPDVKRVLPSFSSLGKLLDDAKYSVEDDTIRKRFVELIASSLHSDTTDLVHPSFSIILSQMTPAEASILSDFYQSSKKLPFKKSAYIKGVSYFTNKDISDDYNRELRDFLSKSSAEFGLLEHLASLGLVKIVDIDRKYIEELEYLTRNDIIGSLGKFLDILPDEYKFGVWNYDIEDVFSCNYIACLIKRRKEKETSYQIKIIEKETLGKNPEYLHLKRIATTSLGEQFMYICTEKTV